MLFHRGIQPIDPRCIEIMSGWSDLGTAVFGDVHYPPRDFVFHEERAAIDTQVRAQFANRGVENVRHVQRLTNGL